MSETASIRRKITDREQHSYHSKREREVTVCFRMSWRTLRVGSFYFFEAQRWDKKLNISWKERGKERERQRSNDEEMEAGKKGESNFQFDSGERIYFFFCSLTLANTSFLPFSQELRFFFCRYKVITISWHHMKNNDILR